jgi:hypothetical protein
MPACPGTQNVHHETFKRAAASEEPEFIRMLELDVVRGLTV